MKYLCIFFCFAAAAQAAPLFLKTQSYGAGQIFVACAIDGQNLHCLVDTGSQISTVADDAFFGSYPSVREVKTLGVSGASQKQSSIRLKDWVVGDKESGAIEVLRASPAEIPLPLLGMDILRSQSFFLDFKKRELRFDVPAPAKTYRMKLAAGYLPAVPAWIASKTTTALVDTGNTLTLIDSSLVRRWPDQFETGGVTDAIDTDTAGTETTMQLWWLKNIVIGGVSLQGLWVAATDFAPIRKQFGQDVSIILGFNATTRKNWFFDFKKSRFCVQ